MKAVIYDVADRMAHWHISSDVGDLAAIYDEDINIAVCRRSATPALQVAVRALMQHGAPLALSVRGHPRAGLLAAVREALPEAAEFQAFGDEVDYLLSLFSELFDLQQVGLRINTLDHAMCPRFHVDRVPVRLVCSYGGPGSEWLPNSAVERSRLGIGSGGLPDDQSGLIRDNSAIQRLHEADIALLKGELWEGNAGNGVVHRSPQLEIGRRRIVVTLDMA